MQDLENGCKIRKIFQKNNFFVLKAQIFDREKTMYYNEVQRIIK
jgi:hypothetical protein